MKEIWKDIKGFEGRYNHSHNNKHAFKTGLNNPRKGASSHAAKTVLNINTGIYYETMSEAAASVKIHPVTLTKRLTKYGFIKC